MNLKLGTREKAIITASFFTLVVVAIVVAGTLIPDSALLVDLSNANLAPSLEHPFGTDWVGRDMLLRTLKGLKLSIWTGIICSLTSSAIAVVLGILGPILGGWFDEAVSWLVDLVMSIPHTILVILISIACGGGFKGVVIGVAATHWTSLTRVIRAEVLQTMESEYVKSAKRFGKSRLYICAQHLFPHIIPQLVVGTILVFPHAIIHEASITFLGFGLPPHEPAIGVILSESMKYLTAGRWWLGLFSGATLVLVSLAVSAVGNNLKRIIDPSAAYKM
ncbi:MAG: ABC transporter permease [Clostridia bacterium]|nr:ABC transporter permease [Clostridia bacterium]